MRRLDGFIRAFIRLIGFSWVLYDFYMLYAVFIGFYKGFCMGYRCYMSFLSESCL